MDQRFGYQPALDGVRAIAVVMVLLFHAGFGWMSGGYVGVSVFFTLSGYLITSLALVEHDRTGRLDAFAFYGRRIRRLLPASLVCLTVVMIAAWLGQFHGVTRLRRDLFAALLQIYNWVLLAAGDGYADQMSRAAGQRAPLDHYWSLAIEEQFYWVWPLVLIVLLRVGARTRVVAVSAMTVAAVISTIAISRRFGAEAVYLATPARLPEILIGAVVAIGMHRRWRTTTATNSGAIPGAAWCCVAGLLAIIGAGVTWPVEGGPAYQGWLPVLALASAALIVGLQGSSPIRRWLSWIPLVALGRISYGVYLYHWPVYTLVDERRLDIGRVPLFAVRVAITVVAATLSYRLVERRFRPPATISTKESGQKWPKSFVEIGWAGVACAVVAAAVLFVPDRGGNLAFVADATREAAAIVPVVAGTSLVALSVTGGGAATFEVTEAARASSRLSRPVRVLVAGDSTAHSTGEGMIQWTAEHRDVMQVSVSAAVGCGLNATGLLPDDDYRETCEEVRHGLVDKVEWLRPDVVVAMVTFRDMEDRLWSAEEGVLTPTDARFRQHLLDGYEAFTQKLLAAGAGAVVWVIPPRPALPPVGDLAPMMMPNRIESYRRVLLALPLSFPDQVAVADMAAWIDSLESDDRPRRSDGLHWTLDGAVRVADEFLVPTVLTVALTETDGESS